MLLRVFPLFCEKYYSKRYWGWSPKSVGSAALLNYKKSINIGLILYVL